MISVIMPVFLGAYPGCAGNRKNKFKRAVQSFLNQGLGELIVVADGCEKTAQTFNEFGLHDNLKLVKLPKQALFSGLVRQAGIEQAKYPWICYLDSDDEFGPNHLKSIADQLDNSVDWLYYDDYLSTTKRNCSVQFTRIGTSCIVHKKSLAAVWPDGYNHDWKFICQLGDNYKKIENTHYIVHHVPGQLDE